MSTRHLSSPYTSKTSNDSSLLSDGNSSRHSSPGSRSRSFSITDILADDSGSRKRSPQNDNTLDKKDKKLMRLDCSPPSSTTNLIPLVQAGNVVLSPVNMPAPTMLPHTTAIGSGSYSNKFTPGYPLGYPLSLVPSANISPEAVATSSLPVTYSYYNTLPAVPQTAQPLHQTTYCYSDGESSGCSQLQENLADMRLSAVNDTSGQENVYVYNTDENGSSGVVRSPPIILKHTKRTSKDDSDYVHHPSTDHVTTPDSSRPPPNYVPNYYQYSWSPHRPTNTTFSPSIFLTRPGTSSIQAHISSSDILSPDEQENISCRPDQFTTSTPIRRGERAYFVSPSHLQSPITSTDRQKPHQDQTSTSEYSSGSDSEMPLLRRPRVPRRRAKARASLSPLLENTNQTAPRPLLPYVPPSTLLTSYTALPQTHYPSFSDSGIVVDASYQRVPYYRPLMEAPTQAPHPATYTSQFQTPVKEADGPAVRAKYAKLCGNSPVTDHLNKTGQIQSVPPRFVCSDRKNDGKRLRLTEAINKSLSESPSQRHQQLPAEWQKLAYGQTDDQRDLTRKARNFLKGRPRVLKFENTSLRV